jgi:hypothetical protein
VPHRGPCREVLFSRDRPSARGSCPQSLDEVLLGCTGCQGILSPFRCPPVPLSLPFPFRCPICCPCGTNNDGNALICELFAPSTSKRSARKTKAPSTRSEIKPLRAGGGVPTVRASAEAVRGRRAPGRRWRKIARSVTEPIGTPPGRSRTFRDAARVGVRSASPGSRASSVRGPEQRPQTAPQGFKPRYAVV